MHFKPRQGHPRCAPNREYERQYGPDWSTVPETSSMISFPSRAFTQDGAEHDLLILIPGAKNTDAIINDLDSEQALPDLRPDMPQDELEELAQFVIRKSYGVNASVHVDNPRTQGFDGHPGIVFDIHTTGEQSSYHHGMVGAFIYETRLYVIVFIVSNEQSLVNHREKVEMILQSVTIYLHAIGTPG